MGWYVLGQIIATLSLALIIHALVAVSRRVPLRDFLREAAPAQAVAFTTQSSLASLPAIHRMLCLVQISVRSDMARF